MPNNSRKYEQKKQFIIETAASVFAQKGFYNTTINDIAKLAGIGKATVYEYFSGKEELFFSVFEWINEKMKDSARVGISALGESAEGRLRILTQVFVSSSKQMQELYSLTLEFWSAAAASPMRRRFQKALRQMYIEYRQMISGIIREGIKNGEFAQGVDAEATAAAVIGAWDGIGLQAWLERDFELNNASNQFLEVMIKGLKK